MAREAGIRTALVSNSWGVHRYPHDLFDELFDGVVISGDEGIRKPSRRCTSSAPSAPASAPQACVYVDDLPFNLVPAEELGMATVHHTERRGRRSPSSSGCSASRCGRGARLAGAPAPSAGRRAGGGSVALAAPVEQFEHPPSIREVRAL